MKIKFKENIALVIVTDYDEETDNIMGETQESFKKDEIQEVDILETDSKNYCDIQFGDGSVAHGVLRECFEIL